jgi:hypothetical protein
MVAAEVARQANTVQVELEQLVPVPALVVKVI